MIVADQSPERALGVGAFFLPLRFLFSLFLSCVILLFLSVFVSLCLFVCVFFCLFAGCSCDSEMLTLSRWSARVGYLHPSNEPASWYPAHSQVAPRAAETHLVMQRTCSIIVSDFPLGSAVYYLVITKLTWRPVIDCHRLSRWQLTVIGNEIQPDLNTPSSPSPLPPYLA